MSYFLNDVDGGGNIVFPLANNNFEVNDILTSDELLLLFLCPSGRCNIHCFIVFCIQWLETVALIGTFFLTSGGCHEQFWQLVRFLHL